ncbi:hypothetical protein LguiA_007003 [Lonicera macranthoides]
MREYFKELRNNRYLNLLEFGASNPQPIGYGWSSPSILYIALGGSAFPIWDI